jgi:hypothetical protein
MHMTPTEGLESETHFALAPWEVPAPLGVSSSGYGGGLIGSDGNHRSVIGSTTYAA